MTDASAAFRRALTVHAAAAGCPVELLSADAHDWASATFVGQRHRLHLRASAGAALSTCIAGLPEAEWRLSGHIVVYVAAELRGDAILVAALTIHDN